jgi:hypothetical protein
LVGIRPECAGRTDKVRCPTVVNLGCRLHQPQKEELAMSFKIQEPSPQTVMPGASAAGTHRRAVLKAAAAAAMLSAGAPLAFAQSAPNALRIGWAISKTGANAGGVSASIDCGGKR